MRISDWSSDVCSSDLHELAGFVVLATDLARVDAEVGVQAVLGRDASFHMCFETFGACLGDGLVRNAGEHAAMAIAGAANPAAGANSGEHSSAHLPSGVVAGVAIVVHGW